MKIQDVLFFLTVLFLIFKRKEKWAAIVGLLCLVFAIPLFTSWIFFTAERLTYYAAGFFLLSIIINIFQLRQKK